MTRVKVCGITNLADALLAAELGADELGFNFYHRSSRCVDSEICRSIASKMPEGIVKVGVFVNETVDEVCRISESVALDVIQVHGDEPPEYLEELRRRSNCRLIKAFRVGPDFDPIDVMNYGTDSILLDAPSDGEYGGTGTSFDWCLASGLNASIGDLYIAGGLTPINVAAAIRAVRPDAVDTASGVELSPGRKDPEKLRSFIAEAKSI